MSAREASAHVEVVARNMLWVGNKPMTLRGFKQLRESDIIGIEGVEQAPEEYGLRGEVLGWVWHAVTTKTPVIGTLNPRVHTTRVERHAVWSMPGMPRCVQRSRVFVHFAAYRAARCAEEPNGWFAVSMPLMREECEPAAVQAYDRLVRKVRKAPQVWLGA